MMSLSDEDLLASATDLTADAKFHINDIKASIAAMSFILSASGRGNTVVILCTVSGGMK